MASNQAVLSGEPADKSLLRLLFIAAGFFGIQYAWAVQYSQMSTFLESLGSVAWLTALIWCAGPITGTLTQPILGSISDRTWTWLGSRRPFLLGGALVCSLCMVLMPNAVSIGDALGLHPLLVAALVLWVWDTSINVCQGPIRWLVVDTVSKKQQALTFSLMGFMLAIGACACFVLGSFITSIHFLFYFGAAAMLVMMGWTILTSPEEKLPHLEANAREPLRVGSIARDIWHGLADMHIEAKKLCWVNGLTWFGAQCMFVFLPLFMAHNIFGTTDTTSEAYTASRQMTSTAWLVYYVVVFAASLFVGRLSARFSMKAIHTVGLLCMGFSLMGMYFMTTPIQAVVAMGIAGVGWATTMAIPFAWAARYSPEGKGGIHLSAFNTYIAFASFIANLVVGWLVTVTGNDASAMMLAGGVALLSAILLQGVKEEPESETTLALPVEELPKAVPAT